MFTLRMTITHRKIGMTARILRSFLNNDDLKRIFYMEFIFTQQKMMFMTPKNANSAAYSRHISMRIRKFSSGCKIPSVLVIIVCLLQSNKVLDHIRKRLNANWKLQRIVLIWLFDDEKNMKNRSCWSISSIHWCSCHYSFLKLNRFVILH